MTVVIGTAGHIDHGKTSLLRALTGIDADRLPEERRRGMTIDVGYAHLVLPDGSELDFVDVPGHDRLIGNMLVGAGEIDAALLVVAADDGPRAQTIEHLELLDALGIRAAVAVVTKVDLVDPARAATVAIELDRILGRTTMAGAPVVAVSAVRGDGLDDLRAALVGLRDRVEDRRPADAAARRGDGVRLAIDRVFSVKGRGTVVTGSLRGGRIERGHRLGLEPGGREARAREVQVHGRAVDGADGGGRVALNLAGLSGDPPIRGDVLTTDPAVRQTDRLLAILAPPAVLGDRPSESPWPPAPGSVLRMHLGTTTVEATIRRGRRDQADLPDGRRVVRLRLARPVAAAIADPFVLRVPSPARTAAGGTVIDVAPPIGASARRTSADALAELALAWLGRDPEAELGARVRLHGLLDRADGRPAPPGARVVASWFLADEIAGDLAAEGVVLVERHRAAEPDAPGAPLAEIRRALARALRRRATASERTAGAVASGVLDALVDAGRLVRTGDLLTDPEHGPTELAVEVRAAMDRLEASLAVPAPPSFREAVRRAGCPDAGVRALESTGRIVRVDDDLAWAGSTYFELEAVALRLADRAALTPAALRDATGTSRKYVMALLEDLDRRGILRRTPDGHVRGPRAPR